MKLLIMNGPNLNFLGIREPDIYGSASYEALLEFIREEATKRDVEVEFFQSNHEGALIDRIQELYLTNRDHPERKIDGVVFNPGALTHYSYAIRDAIESVKGIPFAEVHLSHIMDRESFRHVSVTKEVCLCQISGGGFNSYIQGMDTILMYLKNGVEK